MNYSDLNALILTYLGFHGKGNGETESLISEVLPRVEQAARFRRSEGRFTALPLFLRRRLAISLIWIWKRWI